MTPSHDDNNDDDNVDSAKVSFSESHRKDMELLHEQSLLLGEEEADDMHVY